MSIPGSRDQKFGNTKSSASAQAAINKETPNIRISEGRQEGADPSLKLNQSTATVTVPAHTTSLPGTGESKLSSDQKLPHKGGPQCLSYSTHDVTWKMNDTATTASISLPTQTTSSPVRTARIPAHEKDVVDHELSSTVKVLQTNKEAKNPDPVQPLQQDDKKQRVCNTCKSKYEKEENTSDVEGWLYSDTCPNCHEAIFSHHRSISRLQSPKHHKTTTTNYHEEEVNSCCCF